MKYRTVIRKATRSARELAPRLGAAAMAVVFLTMGGGRGMDAHTASHASHPGHMLGAPPAAGGDHASHHGAGSHITASRPRWPTTSDATPSWLATA